MTKEQLGSLIIASEDSLYRIARSLLCNDSDCADAIQETIVKAFTNLNSLKKDAYAKTWLTRILMNECYMIMRKEKKLISLDTISEKAADEISVLSIQAQYLPEGMEAMEGGGNLYYYQTASYSGGVSIDTIAMDEELSADQLPVSDTYVITSEELTINDRNAIYLERQVRNTQNSQMNKKIYIAYPEYWQIVEMYIGEDVSKEEAIKIAENIDVQTTGETMPLSEVCSWSELLNPEIDMFEAKLAVTREAMKNTHEIGEEFMLTTMASDASGEAGITDAVRVKVTDVKIADDFELLSDAFIEPDLQAALDENGKLIPNDIYYMKSGDGIEMLNEIVGTEKISQKLVYTTVEFTNTGEEELKEIMFGGRFIGLTETADGYTIYDRTAENRQADYIDAGSVGGFGEMDYYDIHSGERDKRDAKKSADR